MQLNSPQQIALFLTIVLCLFVGLLLSANNFFYTIYFQPLYLFISLILFLVVTYFTTSAVIKNYIHNKVKLIYRSLSRQRGTSQKVETDLNRVNEDVDRLVNDRQKEIDDLKNTETFRREFLGNVSHELKTPIFNIQGYIHTLLDGAINDDSVNLKYLKRTSKSVDRMISIVEDLEMISKIESDKLELEFSRWNIVSHVQELFEILEMKAVKRKISLHTDNETKSGFVEADQDKISQVLLNLIENAIKYGKEGGQIKVRFLEMGENILVEVADDGYGIPEEHLPRLFERFYRVDKSRSRNEGGTGLGLSIVKHIIDAHRQNINVRSTENIGTTFSFTLKKSE